MNFVTKEPINKGWSSDKKYCVTDENGTRYLLRVSDIAQHDTKQSESMNKQNGKRIDMPVNSIV